MQPPPRDGTAGVPPTGAATPGNGTVHATNSKDQNSHDLNGKRPSPLLLASSKAVAKPRQTEGDNSWEDKDHLAQKSSKQQLLIRLKSIFNMRRATLIS